MAVYALTCRRDHCRGTERRAALVNNPDPPGRIVVVDDDPTVADQIPSDDVRDGGIVVHDDDPARRIGVVDQGWPFLFHGNDYAYKLRRNRSCKPAIEAKAVRPVIST